MNLRRIIGLSICLALLSPALLSSVAAQQIERRSDGSKESKKKSKRKRQRSSGKLIPNHSTTLPSTATEQLNTISPWARVTSKLSIFPQSLQNPQENDQGIKSLSIRPAEVAVVSMRNLSSKRGKSPSLTVLSPNRELAAPVPGTIAESDSPELQSFLRQGPVDIDGPLLTSPAPAQSFAGEFDEAKGGGTSGTFTIPPDTMGAVGLDKIVSFLNNNIVVQNKITGTRLSVVNIDTFWSAAGGTGAFDPRVLYDPYNNRWLVAAVSSAQTATSSVLVGISQTPDPEGAFTLFRFVVGCAAGAAGCNANGEWADFPMLGFNKNWVAIGWNPFTISTGAFISGKLLVLDYPTLRTGTANGTIFAGISTASGGFCLHPVTTMSATEENLYLPTHISSAAAVYRLHRISGSPSAPLFNLDPADRIRTGGGWTQPGGDTLPQQCIPGVGLPTQTCPPTIRKLDVSDAFIRSNAVFRNGKIYYPQTIALPTGGLTLNSRFAAQWTVLNSDGTFFDGGRVEDATATITNGGKHYAYPSIAVNKNNDVMLGFTESESDDYADAGYSVRLGGDAAGTMRHPVIFKEGEDYYQKTFGGSRNRWGDYSHSVVDPVNDLDLWTIQEYSMLRVGTTGEGANDSRWGTWWAKVAAPAGDGDLLISELRLQGPGGVADEFVEIYNPDSSAFTVNTVDGSAGYALVASDGVTRFTIPNGTVIPARGHFLGVNSAGYSLASYPAGNGTTATGDASYTAEIPDTAGVALFSTSNPANFVLANRIDAVGASSEPNTLYKEGAGFSALGPVSSAGHPSRLPNGSSFFIDFTVFRTFCPSNTGVFGTALGCAPGSGGRPKDTNNNANDFVFADTNGTPAGAGQRLGAPGPENLSSPIVRSDIPAMFLDSTAAASVVPNRLRDFTSDPANNSTFGTLELRRRFQNNTATAITRLRLRVIDLNTFPAPSGFADLRPRTATSTVVSNINDSATCFPALAPCSVTVEGTTLEQPPSQPNGGGFNSTYSAGVITLGTPLVPGASINLRILMGIQQTGYFRFYLNVEALP